jgi:surface protein
MSVRGANYYSNPDIATKTLTAGLNQYPNNTAYVRPADWPALPAIPDGTQKIYVLVAVWPGGGNNVNYVAFNCAGNYTVDWGDGTSDSVSSGVQINHTYDYTNVNLSAVTTRGYKCAIVTITPTGVANLTSATLGLRPTSPAGLANITNAILDVYINAVNLTTLSIGTGAASVRTAYLEQVTIQQNNITAWSSSVFAQCFSLQQIVFLKSSPPPLASVAVSNMFQNCYALKWIVGATPGNMTGCTQWFNTCSSLVEAPFIDTANATGMGSMFITCQSLQQVPLYNTANVVNMGSMFQNSPSIKSVPLFNTAKVTTMASMFNTCTSLQSVPPFNTSNVTSMNAMFSSALSLRSIPVFDTANVTDMATMFNACAGIQTAPTFTSTAKVTTMASMFLACSSLQTVPAYNTGNVLSMSSMFSGCQSMATAPSFTDTSKVTDVTSMFQNCYSLRTVPSYNMASATSGGTTMINTCQSLADFSGYNINQNFTLPAAQLSSSAAGNILANLSIKSAVANTITLALNPGIPASVAKTGVASTAGTAVLTIANTANLSVGMTAISANINSGIATVANTGTNAITLNTHNLVDNTVVSFSTAVFTVGTAYTPLYVVNAATNTFQVANTIGGTALTVTANATPVVNYGRYISAIVANVSVTLAPGYASNTGNGTVNFRTFDTTIATLKNWTVSG